MQENREGGKELARRPRRADLDRGAPKVQVAGGRDGIQDGTVEEVIWGLRWVYVC